MMKRLPLLSVLLLTVVMWTLASASAAEGPAAPPAVEQPVQAAPPTTDQAPVVEQAAPTTETTEMPAAAETTATETQQAASEGHEAAAAMEYGGEEGHHKFSPNPAWILPFIIVLGCIALFPLFAGHWWEHKYPYVAAALFAVGLLYYAAVRRDMHPWLHEMREYVSFIALLFALFVVSGGIVIHVSRKATPAANVLLLLTGAVIANIFGTTGAAMLLIRPYIRINRKHIKPYHIIFFIFIVANVGGCLTPVGDPPLFLGYLKGVPFWWVLAFCWQPWLVATMMLLGIYFVIDKIDHAKEERHDWGEHDTGPAVRINGIYNILLILIVIVAVFQDSVFEGIGKLTNDPSLDSLLAVVFSREVLMVAVALFSYKVTQKGIHEVNEFTFGPIREVAILFLAIFSTMVPALEYLDANAESMPIKTQGNFYFATGTLSSVLDNAPTYLTFLQTRLGEIPQEQVDEAAAVLKRTYEAYEANPGSLLAANLPVNIPDPQVRDAVQEIIHYHETDLIKNHGVLDEAELKLGFLTGVHELNAYLIAISIGAVFFGAMTYIGNAPNFMVKSIAEASGIKMPTFLGYVFRYSIPMLLPVLIAVWAIFLL